MNAFTAGFVGLLSLSPVFCACQSAPKHHHVRDSVSSRTAVLGDQDFNVTVTSYVGAQKSPKTILILPPTGGTNVLDRSYARQFFRAGFDVYILDGWTGQGEKATDLRLHDRLYSRALRAIQLVTENTTTEFTGLFGTSVGATFISVAMGQMSNIDAAFVIVGGVPIPEVIVFSDQKAMRDLKEKRYDIFGFQNDQQYLEALTPEFPLDPTKHRKEISKIPLGMIIATADETVPTKNQNDLRNLWQASPVYSLDSGHFWGIVKAWWSHDTDIVEFFLNAAQKNKMP